MGEPARPRLAPPRTRRGRRRSAATAALDRLGAAEDVFATGKPRHRHALQLAAEAASLESRDARLAAGLRERAAALAALCTGPAARAHRHVAPVSARRISLLAHLAAQGRGVLANDMGLGKTVQALAWLLHLVAERATGAPAPFAPSSSVRRASRTAG